MENPSAAAASEEFPSAPIMAPLRVVGSIVKVEEITVTSEPIAETLRK